VSTGAVLAAINLTISVRTERQWQGIRRPRDRIRALTSGARNGDDAGWDQDHDEAACHQARGCCPGRVSGFHRLGDYTRGLRRWLATERWLKRIGIVIAVLMVIFAGCFGGLWWRLGAGPINLEMATPWLAAAIAEKHRSRQYRRGRRHADRASRPDPHRRAYSRYYRPGSRPWPSWRARRKPRVRLSGTALLMGQLRAESLNLVDAELAVRITPDGHVTVSAGDTAKPLATGVTSKKRGRHCGNVSAPNPWCTIRSCFSVFTGRRRGSR